MYEIKVFSKVAIEGKTLLSFLKLCIYHTIKICEKIKHEDLRKLSIR